MFWKCYFFLRYAFPGKLLFPVCGACFLELYFRGTLWDYAGSVLGLHGTLWDYACSVLGLRGTLGNEKHAQESEPFRYLGRVFQKCEPFASFCEDIQKSEPFGRHAQKCEPSAEACCASPHVTVLSLRLQCFGPPRDTLELRLQCFGPPWHILKSTAPKNTPRIREISVSLGMHIVKKNMQIFKHASY